MSAKISIKIHPVGHKCEIHVDGEDVSKMVSRVIVDAEVGEPTHAVLLGYAISDDGTPYRDTDNHNKVADFRATFIDPELEIEGETFVLKDDEAVEFLKEGAARMND